MSWNGGWCNHYSPETARQVAEAFWAGKYRKRSNCETDGKVYKLEGHVIARRVPPEDVPEQVTNALRGGKAYPAFSFTFAGYPTKTTARHLRALKIDAEVFGIKNPVCRISGKIVDPSTWYTPEMIDELVNPVPPPKVPRPDKAFVNLTLPLF